VPHPTTLPRAPDVPHSTPKTQLQTCKKLFRGNCSFLKNAIIFFGPPNVAEPYQISQLLINFINMCPFFQLTRKSPTKQCECGSRVKRSQSIGTFSLQTFPKFLTHVIISRGGGLQTESAELFCGRLSPAEPLSFSALNSRQRNFSRLHQPLNKIKQVGFNLCSYAYFTKITTCYTRGLH
jgi:hypothetical protein